MRLFNGSMLAMLLAGAAMSMSLGVNGQITWDGGAKDNKWSSANNWSGNSVPTSSDNVLLDTSNVSSSYIVKLDASNSNVNDINDLQINTITLEQSGTNVFTITGNLTIGSGATYDATNASADLKLQGDLTVDGYIDHSGT